MPTEQAKESKIEAPEQAGANRAEQSEAPELVELRPFPWRVTLFIVSSVVIYIAVSSMYVAVGSYWLPAEANQQQATAEFESIEAPADDAEVTGDFERRMQVIDQEILRRLEEKKHQHEVELYEHQLKQNQVFINPSEYVLGHHEQLVRTFDSVGSEAAPLMEDIHKQLADPDFAPSFPGSIERNQPDLADVPSGPTPPRPRANFALPRLESTGFVGIND